MAMVHEVRRQFKEIPGIMEYKAKPEYEKCVEISTQASIKEMMLPGAIALITPVLIGFGFKGVFPDTSSAEMLGGLLAGVTVSGVLMGIFQNNAGGAWDNAKKSFEKGVEIDGKMEYKGSEPHKASVTGDTVGDPFKDTSGPSMNILIKLMSIVSLVIAPHLNAGNTGHGVDHNATSIEMNSSNPLKVKNRPYQLRGGSAYIVFDNNEGKKSKITIESVKFQGDKEGTVHELVIDLIEDEATAFMNLGKGEYYLFVPEARNVEPGVFNGKGKLVMVNKETGNKDVPFEVTVTLTNNEGSQIGGHAVLI